MRYSQKEYGFYLVLPDKNNKNNKAVYCLREGWGGVIDKKIFYTNTVLNMM